MAELLQFAALFLEVKMIRFANRKIRIIALLMVACMVFSMGSPMQVRAASEESDAETLRYPDVLADQFYQDENDQSESDQSEEKKSKENKDGFVISESSRFYIVTDETESEQEDGGQTADAKKADSNKADADKAEADPQDADPSEENELYDTVALMAAQFARYGIPSNEPLLVFYGSEEYTLPGDIVIKLIPGKANQSYKIDITDRAVITGAGNDGVYYGLITLLEIALKTHAPSMEDAYYNSYSYSYGYQDGAQDEDGSGENDAAGPVTIGKMTIEDGPDLEERAIFLDCGRKYFTTEWIKNLIRRASFQRYNTLILHFSEAQGLRLDSRVFPWLTEDIDSLSMTEMADIVSFAGKYHMKVIPSFDVPGHNKFIIDKYESYVSEHPDFTFEYGGKTYGPAAPADEGPADTADEDGENSEGAAEDNDFASIANHYTHNGVTVESNSIGIDLTKEHAVAFLDAMIDDYAYFFKDLGCTDFDMGGDEVLGYASFNIGGDTLIHENRWDFVEHWGDYAQGVMKIPGGSPSDTFIHYLNRTALRLMRMGYTCRVFNDEIDVNTDQHFRLLPAVELSYWNAGRRSAKHFAETGHKVYNCVSRWCYFASGRVDGVDIMNGKYYSVNSPNIYENWDSLAFTSTTMNPKPVPEEMAAGGYFCIWCDEPDYKSEETIWEEVEMRTWANSARLWNALRREYTEDGYPVSREYGTEENEQKCSYNELEYFAGLARDKNDYKWFTGENRILNGSGKPLSGEDWWIHFVPQEVKDN